ncbi:hypothetical protein [Kaarinaea lacus]
MSEPIVRLLTLFRRASRRMAVSLLFIHSLCIANDNLWDVLNQEGRTLDIMSINSVADQLMFIGARYVELPSPAREQSEVSPVFPPLVRKQLFMMRVAPDEKVLWQQTYPVLPDVHEIYSAAASANQHLCIIYGEQSSEDEVILDPVLLQIDVHGKILWAKRNLITVSNGVNQGSGSLEQIANLDTLRVTTSPDNGCVLTYVTRTVEGQDEKFRLHISQHSAEGNVQWHQALDTELYGKLFLVRNEQANRYMVVQTNQSRDAAVRAMMLAVPFAPKTALIGIDYQGKVSFQRIDPQALSKLWVKTVLDANGKFILIAGKTKTAWAGLVNQDGEIKNYTDKLDDEFSASAAKSSRFLLARGDHVTLTTGNLDIVSDQPTKDVTIRQYLNQYLMARLPDDLPVQQIIPAGNNEFLLLYTLGSKLLKVRLDRTKQ